MKQSLENRTTSKRGFLQLSLGAALILLAVSHWFPLGIHVLELLCAFAHLTILVAVVVAGLSIIFRFRVLLVSGIIAAAISSALVLPHFLPSDYSGEADFSVGHYNLWHHNPTAELAFQSIETNTPDVFTFQEMNASWAEFTDSVFAQTHPYTVEVPMEACCYGIGLFSKFPIVSYKVLDLEDTPVILAQLLVQNRTVTIISLHTRPPAFPDETERRNKQLETVASIAAAETTDCIVLGDFNVVPWDDVLKEFLKSGNLEVVRDGFQATYPMDLGFPLIPIDHITCSGKLTSTWCETVKFIGSDHKGIVAGFAFAD